MTDSARDKTSKKLLKSTAIFAFMTTLSRVLGLVRDIIFARFIGAEAGADAFFVAFKIPNFMRRLFSEGAFAQAFVPVLSELRENGSRAAIRQFVDHIAGCLGMSLIGVTAFSIVAAPVIAMVFAPGFYFNNPEKYQLTTELIRITFSYLMFISLTGFLGAILNSYDQFAGPAFTPVILNIVLITAAVAVAPNIERPVDALAWGVFVAGLLQFGFQVPFVARLGLLPRPKPNWKDSQVKKVLRLMAPAMFGVSVSQINLLLDTVLASFLPNGSVSWLYYSDRLTELPLGVFGVGIATVILPTLSRQFTAGSEAFSKTLDWALRTILLIAIPAAVALSLLAEPIIFTLFHYGSFKATDVTMAAYSLRAYALGLTAFMLIKVLASAFYSRQNTKTPVKIGIVAMVANMLLNVVFVAPLYFFWGIGHAGLALATSGSAFINAGLLLRRLLKERVYQPESAWLIYLTKLMCASAAMALGLYIAVLLVGSFEQMEAWRRGFHTAWMCLLGALIYAIALIVCGIRPAHLKPGSFQG